MNITEEMTSAEDKDTDESWLVQRAMACLKTDPAAAKSWLITARTLFPRSFMIQYEAYNIEKSKRNISDVAQLLKDMLRTFPQEPQLWTEVRSLSDALQSDSSDEKTVFLKDLFAALPQSLQCHLLLQVAENSVDVLSQCRLMLLLLNRYPDRVPEQGVKLLDTVISAEKHAQNRTPVNCYRKYVVCDILPLVLASRSLQDVSNKQFYRWMQKSIEFVICYMTLSATSNVPASNEPRLSSPTQAQTPDLTSPTKKTFGSAQRLTIPGLSPKDSYISDPWQRLFSIIQMVGQHLGWDLSSFGQEKSSIDNRWQCLQHMYDILSQQSDPGSHFKQVLYPAMALFFHSTVTYTMKTQPEQFSGGGGNTQTVALIEGFKEMGDSSGAYVHKTKKLKTDKLPPVIQPSTSLAAGGDMVQSFTIALKCWELLHSANYLEREFRKLVQHWKGDNWNWLKNFEVDVFIYQAQYREAVNILLALQQRQTSTAAKMKTDLQIACCYFCLNNFPKACETVLNMVSYLPAGSPAATIEPPSATGSSRLLQLLPCSEVEVLPYCILLMITCFREKAFKTMLHDDTSLGHMIVLLQYDWPKHESLLVEVIDKIRRQGSFTYGLFFNYVINIDILEEFAYIKTQEGGKVNLDILPTSTKMITQSRTVTRGVNKGVKEDFKTTMEKQVARCGENMEHLIRLFLKEERNVLQQSLL